MTGTYRFAKLNISVISVYSDVHRMCSDYATDGKPDVQIKTSESDIDFEREKSERGDIAEGRKVRIYSDGYLETLAVYRKIAEIMPTYDTVLFHGSCVAVDGEGYLFAAKSGTGKSTHTRLWRQLFGERAVMINDDKPLIRVTDAGAVVYGTAWNGKHKLSTNTSVPLKALCLLRRGENNEIQRISRGEAYAALLQQVYRPSDSDAMSKTMILFDRLLSSVDLWWLSCNMEPEAARVAYEAMKGCKI